MRTLILALFVVGTGSAAEPCVSGPSVGQRPGPYSFLVATGPQRGQQTCYVCETAEKPGIIVFARKLSEPLGKLAVVCDEIVVAQPKDSARGWLTVLGEKTATLDELAKWGKELGLKQLPLGVFDDPIGPPSYKLHNDAEITVLLFTNRKVVGNFTFRTGELTDDGIKKIREALTKLVEKK